MFEWFGVGDCVLTLGHVIGGKPSLEPVVGPLQAGDCSSTGATKQVLSLVCAAVPVSHYSLPPTGSWQQHTVKVAHRGPQKCTRHNLPSQHDAVALPACPRCRAGVSLTAAPTLCVPCVPGWALCACRPMMVHWSGSRVLPLPPTSLLRCTSSSLQSTTR